MIPTRNDCRQWIIDAGNLMKGNRPEDIETKTSFKDIVTGTDKQIQEYLVERIRSHYPEAGFLCEENGLSDFESHDFFFIIDPIDGTTNYACGYNQSAVSVACADHEKILWGIVYNPFSKKVYEAACGEGAYMNQREIHVTTAPLSENLVGFGISPYNPELTKKVFELGAAVANECMDLRRIGTAALELAHVAANRTGAFFEPFLRPWDYAAGLIIVEEAGGKVVDFNGRKVNFTQDSGIIAGSVENVDCILRIKNKIS